MRLRTVSELFCIYTFSTEKCVPLFLWLFASEVGNIKSDGVQSLVVFVQNKVEDGTVLAPAGEPRVRRGGNRSLTVPAVALAMKWNLVRFVIQGV